MIGLSVFSCADNNQDSVQDQPQHEEQLSVMEELELTKQEASDALNLIQISGSQLYSTFANQKHECEGVVGSFVMNQKQFEDALLYLLNEYYPSLGAEEKIELANKASLGQFDYIIKTCGSTSEELVVNEYSDPPRKGMWIFKSLMNQADLIIKW